MNMRAADTDFDFVMPRQSERQNQGPGPVGRFGAMVQWLMDMPRRRAVINELDALSDHELADIGLARGDVRRVFDRSFKVERQVI